MSQRTVCLCLLILLSMGALVHVCRASTLKALSIATKAVKGLKKLQKLTPIFLLVRKKPLIIVIKKNCQHSTIPESGLGGLSTFNTYDWNSDFHSFPPAQYFR